MMVRYKLGFYLLLIPFISYGQKNQIEKFLSDSSMIHSSVSLVIADAGTGSIIFQYNPDKSLIQASILKLITSAVALEKFGKDYTFKTSIGYSGKIRKRTGSLEGNLIIKGGGDPTLGSENFPEFYNGFIDKWIKDIKALGIKNITGRIIADDSYYDYQPVPGGWNWEDIGNYYGAGAYGLSVFDNILQIHFKTSAKGSLPVITRILPVNSGIEYENFLTTSGTDDNGYIFSVPYGNKGWIAGTIPENKEDFILKGSIPDPPLFLAKTLHQKLRDAGIKIEGKPLTTRLMADDKAEGFKVVSETISPPLSAIIKVLNQKSVNLYAEHLLKELGKVFRNSGSTTAGIEVVKEFLDDSGIKTEGIFMEDGSGLSSRDAVNSAAMVRFLYYMKKNGRFFDEYLKSLPEPGNEGTLKNYFKDPVFKSRLWAKSGSMARVRSYAGYVKTISGKEMIFCIIINNFNGSSRNVVSGIEEIIKDAIINN
jgi:serine-type D-Ala-D-Ala carboxypeptidase/endopeptidase (penicillin-binding protein 4)